MAKDGLSITVITKPVDNMLDKFRPEMKTMEQRFYNIAGLLTQRQMRIEAPTGVSSRGVGETIVYEVSSDKVVIHPTKRYGQYDATVIEKGRRPGKMPPYSAEANPDFYKWAKSKGIEPAALAHHIAKKGTKGTKFVEKTFKNVQPEIGRASKAEVDRLTALMNGK